MEIRPGIFIKKEPHQRIWIIDEPYVTVIRQSDSEFILYTSDLSNPAVAFIYDQNDNTGDLLGICIGVDKYELVHAGENNIKYYIESKEITNNGSKFKLI